MELGCEQIQNLSGRVWKPTKEEPWLKQLATLTARPAGPARSATRRLRATVASRTYRAIAALSTMPLGNGYATTGGVTLPTTMMRSETWKGMRCNTAAIGDWMPWPVRVRVEFRLRQGARRLSQSCLIGGIRVKMNLAQLQALAVQQAQVMTALESFTESPDYDGLVESYALTGNYLFLHAKTEYWFEYHLDWHTDQPMRLHKTGGWAHVFTELADFDRMMGNPDPEPSWGFRSCDSISDAMRGLY